MKFGCISRSGWDDGDSARSSFMFDEYVFCAEFALDTEVSVAEGSVAESADESVVGAADAYVAESVDDSLKESVWSNQLY